jgi:hypothetical protein
MQGFLSYKPADDKERPPHFKIGTDISAIEGNVYEKES